MEASEKSRVALVYCDSYDEDKVYNALTIGIEAIGGIEHFVHRDERILVKPNFLVAAKPDKAIITHPSVIKGMLRILKEHGFEQVVCGDSPGHGSLDNALHNAGLSEAITQFGYSQADMSTEVLTDYPEGITARQFYFARAVTEADAIIGLSKMKTHALEKITGAVKNMYGLICGYRKAAGHVSFPNASMFARMLADIHRATPQRLHIMDGIVAMEGNGPASGNPVAMNVLLLSSDPVALDTVFCTLINVDPKLIPTNAQGEQLGIGKCNLDKIDILEVRPYDESENDYKTDERKNVEDNNTREYSAINENYPVHETDSVDKEKINTNKTADDAKKYTVKVMTAEDAYARYGNGSFDVDRTGGRKTFLSRFSDIMTSFARRPYIDAALCIKCGICTEHCPVPGKAVDFKNGRQKPPVYDYRKCIRCYCCQEMCPQHAIKVHNIIHQ